MWRSPPPTNTSKLHLHVESFSLKTNWKLAEGLLYNQGCEKDPHITAQEGKESDQVGTCAPWEGTQRKGRIQRWTHWGVRGESRRLGAWVLGSYVGRPAALAGWRTSGAGRRAMGRLGSDGEQRAHWLAREAGLRGQRQDCSGAAGFPTTTSACAPDWAELTLWRCWAYSHVPVGHLYTVGGNVNWCSHCGKQYGGFSKN